MRCLNWGVVAAFEFASFLTGRYWALETHPTRVVVCGLGSTQDEKNIRLCNGVRLPPRLVKMDMVRTAVLAPAWLMVPGQSVLRKRCFLLGYVISRPLWA